MVVYINAVAVIPPNGISRSLPFRYIYLVVLVNVFYAAKNINAAVKRAARAGGDQTPDFRIVFFQRIERKANIIIVTHARLIIDVNIPVFEYTLRVERVDKCFGPRQHASVLLAKQMTHYAV